ncbi:minor capsid protein [Capybara microvirus Cap3_SP_264]|nr:minor capsid protein [Capybara microvirus Cap3_SP_264]
MNELGAATISAGSGLLGSIVSGLFGNHINNQNIAFQQQQNETNMAWQERMLAEQRAYDSPSAQYQRLRDAGINPAFAGLNSNISTGQTGEVPEPATSAPQAYNFASDLGSQVAGIGSSFSSTYLKAMQANADVKQAEANAARSDADALQIKALLPHKVTNFIRENDKLFNEISLIQSRIDYLDSGTLLNLVSKSEKDLLMFPKYQTYKGRFLNLMKDLETKDVDISLTKKQSQFIDDQMARAWRQLFLNEDVGKSEIGLNQARTQTESTLQTKNTSEANLNTWRSRESRNNVSLRNYEVTLQTTNSILDRINQQSSIKLGVLGEWRAKPFNQMRKEAPYFFEMYKAGMEAGVESLNSYLNKSGHHGDNPLFDYSGTPRFDNQPSNSFNPFGR